MMVVQIYTYKLCSTVCHGYFISISFVFANNIASQSEEYFITGGNVLMNARDVKALPDAVIMCGLRVFVFCLSDSVFCIQ